MKFTIPMALATAALVATPAFAEEKAFNEDAVAAMQGDIVIEAPYAVSMKDDEIVVFMTVHNAAKADDVITAVSSEAAEKASFAKYEGRGSNQKVKTLERIEMPGGNAVMMDQDGYHVLLTDLKKPVKGGDTIPLILTFAENGEMKVEVSVAVLN